MIKSMTGFGKASEKSPYGKITAEVKTLNHKSKGLNGFWNTFQPGIIFRGKLFL